MNVNTGVGGVVSAVVAVTVALGGDGRLDCPSF